MKEEEYKCYQLIARCDFEDQDFDPEVLSNSFGLKGKTIADFMHDTEFGKVLDVNYDAKKAVELDFEEDERVYVFDFGSHYMSIFQGRFVMNYYPSDEEIKMMKESALNLIHLNQIRAIRNNDVRKMTIPIGENLKVVCDNEAIINENENVYFELYVGEYMKDRIVRGQNLFAYKYTPIIQYANEIETRDVVNKMHDSFVKNRFPNNISDGLPF